jgi:hypothetical protein
MQGWRFEVVGQPTLDLSAIKITCCHCGKPIDAVRQREGGGSPYLAFTCPQKDSIRCSRQKVVRVKATELAGVLNERT